MTQSPHKQDRPPRSQWLSLRTFCIARITIAAVLLISYSLLTSREPGAANAEFNGWSSLALEGRLALGYLLVAFVLLMITQYWQKHFHAQLIVQVIVDLFIITILFSMAGGLHSGLSALYLAPVAAGAILAPQLLALGFAALGSLAILGESTLRYLSGSQQDSALLMAATVSTLCFVIALIMQRLGQRLIRQETLAEQRGEQLLRQQQISEKIVADMPTGVIQLDKAFNLLMSNKSALRMLGLAPDTKDPLIETPHLQPFFNAVIKWQKRSDFRLQYFLDITLGDPEHEATLPSRHLRLRFFSPAGENPETIVLIQDLDDVESQAQQLKLAALGRLTAGVAHEVRNPLSAISHAAALIGEDITDPLAQRMLRIINDNVTRLNRLIEDILTIGKRDRFPLEILDLDQFIETALHEWLEINPLPSQHIALELKSKSKINFRASHLRHALFNLLDNAKRYASDKPGCLRISSEVHDDTYIYLRVLDDGPGVAANDRPYLFEPFFTTRASGTGLGLYLTREFCLANHAELIYIAPETEPRKNQMQGFLIRIPKSVTHLP